MGNEINTRTQILLASYVGKMSASMQVAANEKKLKYSDGYYYKRVKLPLSANGMQDLLLNDDSQKDGFCSISKQKINQGCAFMADRFTFKASVYTVPSSDPVAYDSWSEGAQVYTSLDELPAAVKAAIAALTCAELEFTVNGDRQWIAPVNNPLELQQGRQERFSPLFRERRAAYAVPSPLAAGHRAPLWLLRSSRGLHVRC